MPSSNFLKTCRASSFTTLCREGGKLLTYMSEKTCLVNPGSAFRKWVHATTEATQKGASGNVWSCQWSRFSLPHFEKVMEQIYLLTAKQGRVCPSPLRNFLKLISSTVMCCLTTTAALSGINRRLLERQAFSSLGKSWGCIVRSNGPPFKERYEDPVSSRMTKSTMMGYPSHLTESRIYKTKREEEIRGLKHYKSEKNTHIVLPSAVEGYTTNREAICTGESAWHLRSKSKKKKLLGYDGVLIRNGHSEN